MHSYIVVASHAHKHITNTLHGSGLFAIAFGFRRNDSEKKYACTTFTTACKSSNDQRTSRTAFDIFTFVFMLERQHTLTTTTTTDEWRKKTSPFQIRISAVLCSNKNKMFALRSTNVCLLHVVTRPSVHFEVYCGRTVFLREYLGIQMKMQTTHEWRGKLCSRTTWLTTAFCAYAERFYIDEMMILLKLYERISATRKSHFPQIQTHAHANIFSVDVVHAAQLPCDDDITHRTKPIVVRQFYASQR